jgi:hypothetical protein
MYRARSAGIVVLLAVAAFVAGCDDFTGTSPTTYSDTCTRQVPTHSSVTLFLAQPLLSRLIPGALIQWLLAACFFATSNEFTYTLHGVNYGSSFKFSIASQNSDSFSVRGTTTVRRCGSAGLMPLAAHPLCLQFTLSPSICTDNDDACLSGPYHSEDSPMSCTDCHLSSGTTLTINFQCTNSFLPCQMVTALSIVSGGPGL